MVGVMEGAAAKAGRKGMAKILADIQTYHISPEDAAQVAQDAEVDMLAFNHIVPVLPNKSLYKYFLGDAGDKFDGLIIVGEDGMFFTMPAGSDEIKRSRLD